MIRKISDLQFSKYFRSIGILFTFFSLSTEFHHLCRHCAFHHHSSSSIQISAAGKIISLATAHPYPVGNLSRPTLFLALNSSTRPYQKAQP